MCKGGRTSSTVSLGIGAEGPGRGGGGCSDVVSLG